MVDSRLGCQSSSIKNTILNNEALPKTLTRKEIVNNKQKLRLSIFFQMVYHKCSFCYKRILHPAHRDRHMRTHAGEKPFPAKNAENVIIVARGSGTQAKESGTCELVLGSSLFPAHSAGKGLFAGILKRHAETHSRSVYI